MTLCFTYPRLLSACSEPTVTCPAAAAALRRGASSVLLACARLNPAVVAVAMAPKPGDPPPERDPRTGKVLKGTASPGVSQIRGHTRFCRPVRDIQYSSKGSALLVTRSGILAAVATNTSQTHRVRPDDCQDYQDPNPPYSTTHATDPFRSQQKQSHTRFRNRTRPRSRRRSRRWYVFPNHHIPPP